MDFGKIRSSRTASRPTDPIKIFESLPSLDGAPNDLWRGQAEALRRWNVAREKSDVVVSLTTGAGKTVVGLLIAQSLVHEGLRNVVYLCSTNDLVMQTSKEASGIGIAHTTRIGRDWSNDLFETEKGFCITNYHALFNGHSAIIKRFRPEAILFDDAHVAEGIIRDAYTLKITLKDHVELYRQISSLFSGHFEELAIRGKFEKAAGHGGGEMVMATPRGMKERVNQLDEILRHGVQTHNSLSYAHAHLADHLASCILVIADGVIEIAPPFIPTLTHRGFKQDIRRIYLSATLQSQVEFVRSFGRKPSEVIEPENDAGNGERLILTGHKVDGGFGPDFVRKLTKLRKAVVAVPSYIQANSWKMLSTPPKAENFTAELEAFRVQQKGVFVLVSRADGIDLPAETCRIMILEGVPTGSSLIERLQYERLEMQGAQDRRIAGRITQLFGRINRGRNDYGVFLIEGRDLGVWLARDRSVALLPPLLRQQIVVGRQVQEDMGIKGPDQAIEITEAVLNRDQGWVNFYSTEVRSADLDEDIIARTAEAENGLVEAALAEARYAEAIWEGDYARARTALERVAVSTEAADTKLSGWHEIWIAATHEADGDPDAANDHYDIARRRLPDYLRLPRRPATVDSIGNLKNEDPFFEQMLYLTQPTEAAAYEKRLRKFQSDLVLIDTGTPRQAEVGVRTLGELLGFKATRPDNDDMGTGPDVIWESLTEKQIVSFELKTDKVADTATYKKEKDIGQGHNHLQWMTDQYPDHTCLGLLYVGPDGPVEPKANIADTMKLCTTDRMAGLRDRWLALLRDIRATTPAHRRDRLTQIGESEEWTLVSIINSLGLDFVVKK